MCEVRSEGLSKEKEAHVFLKLQRITGASSGFGLERSRKSGFL